MDNSVIVSLRDIVVDFDGQRILNGLNLDIHDKEFVTLLGSSGCGKTTTLRLIAGFLEPNAGTVSLHGKDITGVPPYKRPVNTVFQKYALFPHLNVFENVAFGLRLKHMDEDNHPHQGAGYAGGGGPERLRAAQHLPDVGRPAAAGGPSPAAWSTSRRSCCWTSPLGALDLKLRKEMQLELKRLQREMNITFIYVTHDQEEGP